MTSSGGTLSQLEALFVQLPENDSFESNPPGTPVRIQEEIRPQAPSPFEDYQQFPFHWTGESMRTAPLAPSPSTNLERSALIAQFPMLDSSQLEKLNPPKHAEPDNSGLRKRRFRQLRRALSLTHIRHKPTAPDTAPPTPTVPNQLVSSTGVKSIESLAHWQLPDPTAAPTSLDGNLLVWPPSLLRNTRPSDQLSPPSSIPSESDILPPDIFDLPIDRNPQTLETPSLSPQTAYPPALYDSINLSDPNILEKGPNGKVIAGTVEGLVAYITSPDCLDYEVLSDFFMMYRKFIEPSKLLGLLFARYEWGLIRGAVVRPPDNEGMVRVRTFAALRHWLLNYFADDFAPSASLRCQFIKYIKAFAKDRRVKASGRDTKIITELRRCWKKVCTIYWDETSSRTNGAADDQIPAGEPSPKNRIPSLIFRATKDREQRLGSVTSQSQPDLRKRFLELGGTGTVNSTRPAAGRGHTRIHSTSSIDDRPRSQFRHKRNVSAEPHVLYSKNSDPALYQSFARGDGTQEWPSVIVRGDLLVTSPKTGSTRPTWRQTRKRLFQTRRKAMVPPPKSPTKIGCLGELSDDENDSRWTRKIIPSVSTSEPSRDRVDFLAAGMWASFITAANATGESFVSTPRAEELGEALVQGYIQPAKVDDIRALTMAKELDKGKEVAVDIPPILFDRTMTSSESQGYQTTLSMSEIERRLGSAVLTSIPPMPNSSDSFRRIDADIHYSDQRISHASVDSPASSSIVLPVQPLRRRPGGNLRTIETIGELQLRPQTMLSVRSSLSSFSLVLVDDRSNLDIPRISAESRSLRSLLNIPQSNHGSRTPRRASGLALDFSRFQMPEDIESSDDENCDPEEAVQKTLLKLEGKYISKKRRTPRSVVSEEPEIDEYCEITFDSEDLGRSSAQRSRTSGSPPASLIIEKNPDVRWARRHKHIVDGNECDTPTRHRPFTSSIFEFIESPARTDEPSLYPDATEEVKELAIPLPTVESALAELERDQLEEMTNRPPHIAPPKPPENYHRSLAAHLPFILQYDSSVLARQFTLIEKDICAEIDWAELIEPTWMERNTELVDVRDWKGFVVRDEGDRGLDTVMARFNLMAGWTTSEIVLTQSLPERIKVVSKFIHIAEACRRIHNYATLTQIVMGLQSNHISALKKTWEGLNSEDSKLWKDLQSIVDSRKNWSRMRNEMDRSSAGPRAKGEGCIPFLGIFMTDLVHISPRSPTNNRIDFEGLRQRASIVKRTLRMIELADEYDIRPEAGVGERCLWITAFDEPMLRRIAAGLESRSS